MQRDQIVAAHRIVADAPLSLQDRGNPLLVSISILECGAGAPRELTVQPVVHLVFIYTHVSQAGFYQPQLTCQLTHPITTNRYAILALHSRD